MAAHRIVPYNSFPAVDNIFHVASSSLLIQLPKKQHGDQFILWVTQGVTVIRPQGLTWKPFGSLFRNIWYDQQQVSLLCAETEIAANRPS